MAETERAGAFLVSVWIDREAGRWTARLEERDDLAQLSQVTYAASIEEVVESITRWLRGLVDPISGDASVTGT